MLAGFRLSEWAQPDGYSNPHYPYLNHLIPPANTTRAVCPRDFRVQTITRQRITGLDTLQVPLENIRRMWCKFRTRQTVEIGDSRVASYRC